MVKTAASVMGSTLCASTAVFLDDTALPPSGDQYVVRPRQTDVPVQMPQSDKSVSTLV